MSDPGRAITPEEAILGVERPTPEQEAEAKKLADEKAEVRRRFLLGLIHNELFREWLMGHLLAFQTFSQPFGVSPSGFPDPMATQFHLGMKAAGWTLWEEFDNLAPEMASLMRREASKPAPDGTKRTAA